jgi:hypothetical protein
MFLKIWLFPSSDWQEVEAAGFHRYHPERWQIFTKPHAVTFKTNVIFIVLLQA